MKKISNIQKITLVGFVLVGGMLGIATEKTVHNEENFEIAKNLEIFSEMYREVNTYYVDELDANKLIRTSMDAMLHSLDPYTVFISAEQAGDFQFQITGKYDGIGAVVRKHGNESVVTDLYEGAPAEQAGLLAGDVIMSIDGKSVAASGNTDGLKGMSGSEVVLKVKRPGESGEKTIKIKRGEIKVPNVPFAARLEGDLAYIVLSTYTENAGRNVALALNTLRQKGEVKGIVLDLRGNGGGLLNEAVDLTNVFVKKDERIVDTKGKLRDYDRSFKTLNKPVDTEIPLVVLVDQNSASASEITAGAVQDLDRGVLVGRRSFGKGLVQNTREVGYDARVKLTTSKYYTPSGRCIQATTYKDGMPVDISDSLRTAFRTKNGRVVYDGGGILPDVRVEQPKASHLLEQLQKQHVIFDFATQYCQKKSKLEGGSKFVLSEVEYQEFVSYTDGRKFSYESDSEKKLNELIEKSKAEGYYTEISSELTAMQQRIAEDRKADFKRYRAEIAQAIEKELVNRFYHQKGVIEHNLKQDPDVKAAIEVLRDPVRYRKLLGA